MTVGLLRLLEIFCTSAEFSFGRPPLLIIAPLSVIHHLQAAGVSIFGSSNAPVITSVGHLTCRVVTCDDFNNTNHPYRIWLHRHSQFLINSFLSVRVTHCYDAYGVVSTLFFPSEISCLSIGTIC